MQVKIDDVILYRSIRILNVMVDSVQVKIDDVIVYRSA